MDQTCTYVVGPQARKRDNNMLGLFPSRVSHLQGNLYFLKVSGVFSQWFYTLFFFLDVPCKQQQRRPAERRIITLF